MSLPDFTKRNLHKNKGRLWTPHPVTIFDMVKHIAAEAGGVNLTEDRAAKIGGEFFIGFSSTRNVKQFDDDYITTKIAEESKYGWLEDLAGMVNTNPDVSTVCPWCGSENYYNTGILTAIHAFSPGMRDSKTVFRCQHCNDVIGSTDLWARSRTDKTENYPNEAYKQAVHMFAYPIKDKNGKLHGMPFHKGLLKNQGWIQTESPSGRYAKVEKADILAYVQGTAVWDDVVRLTRFLVLKTEKGSIIREFINIPREEGLRLLGVCWNRKHIYVGCANRHLSGLSERGRSIYYALVVKPTAKHRKNVTIRHSSAPRTFEWMDTGE